MFRARTWSALLLACSMVFLMGARQVPLTDPQPIAVPAGLKVEQVSKAIRASLAGRAWAVTSEEPGHMVSTLNVREHMYAEKKGQRMIHRNYLNWILNLVNDMNRNLVLVQS